MKFPFDSVLLLLDLIDSKYRPAKASQITAMWQRLPRAPQYEFQLYTTIISFGTFNKSSAIKMITVPIKHINKDTLLSPGPSASLRACYYYPLQHNSNQSPFPESIGWQHEYFIINKAFYYIASQLPCQPCRVVTRAVRPCSYPWQRYSNSLRAVHS